jgi:hypothetical protein
MQTTTDKTIAATILEQLGGRKFIAMTGAKNMLNHGNALSLRLPSRFATDGINYVKVTLTHMDDYTLEFGKVRGMNYKLLKSIDGVYCDQLQEIFTATTGLDTHL